MPAARPRTKKSAPEPSKSEQTRQRILDAAATVFADRGYAHTRLTDVAREAGSHAGGIYYYFASREALVEELLRICTERSVADLREALAALPADASTADRIYAAAHAQLAGIMASDPYVLAYNRIFLQVPEDVVQRHREVLHTYFDMWRSLIREGQARGELRADLDPAVLRLTVTGAIQWAAQWANAERGTPEQLARKMVDLFLRGCLNPPATAPASPA